MSNLRELLRKEVVIAAGGTTYRGVLIEDRVRGPAQVVYRFCVGADEQGHVHSRCPREARVAAQRLHRPVVLRHGERLNRQPRARWRLALVALVCLHGCASAALAPDAADPLLRPVQVSVGPAAALAPLPLIVAGDRDWRLESFDPARGLAHLVHYTATLRFADDVRVQATPVTAGESRISATSTSRIGIDDFGQNARNLAELMTRLRGAWTDAGVAWREATAATAP